MNKPRLIDANELIKCIEYWYESCSPRTDVRDMVICDTLDSVLQHIDDIPTAYDVQGVVEQLEARKKGAENVYADAIKRCNSIEALSYITQSRVYMEAIEIVKGGLDGSRNDSTSR